MEISKPLAKLILDALQETNEDVRYEVTTRELITEEIKEEGVTAKRYWFIDDEENEVYIRATQFQANPLLETLDILEQIRIHKSKRDQHYNSYLEYEHAYAQAGMRAPAWPLLENFYKQFRKKDHQLLAKIDTGYSHVALVVKDEDNMFLLVDFSKGR